MRSKHQTNEFSFFSGDLFNSSFFLNNCSQVGKSHGPLPLRVLTFRNRPTAANASLSGCARLHLDSTRGGVMRLLGCLMADESMQACLDSIMHGMTGPTSYLTVYNGGRSDKKEWNNCARSVNCLCSQRWTRRQSAGRQEMYEQ
jgi:hypothetical protein